MTDIVVTLAEAMAVATVEKTKPTQQARAVMDFLKGHGLVIAPFEPTAKMLSAARRPIEHYRGSDEWISNKEKHRIRYQAMLLAIEGKKHPLVKSESEDVCQ